MDLSQPHKSFQNAISCTRTVPHCIVCLGLYSTNYKLLCSFSTVRGGQTIHRTHTVITTKQSTHNKAKREVIAKTMCIVTSTMPSSATTMTCLTANTSSSADDEAEIKLSSIETTTIRGNNDTISMTTSMTMSNENDEASESSNLEIMMVDASNNNGSVELELVVNSTDDCSNDNTDSISTKQISCDVAAAAAADDDDDEATSSEPQTDGEDDEHIDYWIFHERQEALFCGKHALNNLLQVQQQQDSEDEETTTSGGAFSVKELQQYAKRLDDLERELLSALGEDGDNEDNESNDSKEEEKQDDSMEVDNNEEESEEQEDENATTETTTTPTPPSPPKRRRFYFGFGSRSSGSKNAKTRTNEENNTCCNTAASSDESEESSNNADSKGNFSIEVLRFALMEKYKLDLPHIRQEGLLRAEDSEDEFVDTEENDADNVVNKDDENNNGDYSDASMEEPTENYDNDADNKEHKDDETSSTSTDGEKEDEKTPEPKKTKGLLLSDMEGFICHRNDHWFAIRKINGKYWNLDSMIRQPKLISSVEELKQIIEKIETVDGGSIFCVPSGLPKPVKSKKSTTKSENLWSEKELLELLDASNNDEDVPMSTDEDEPSTEEEGEKEEKTKEEIAQEALDALRREHLDEIEHSISNGTYYSTTTSAYYDNTNNNSTEGEEETTTASTSTATNHNIHSSYNTHTHATATHSTATNSERIIDSPPSSPLSPPREPFHHMMSSSDYLVSVYN